ncbi:MAG: methylmalonyl-CoA mutase subunit beta [Pseudonocardia sp.]|nr:methylmalonyl-CoA mutase subunit beta [Pseudonocardia sp.]
MVDADTPPPAPPDELVLAGEFPAATREQWTALVDGVLRKSGRIGSDAEAGAGVERLVRRTPEGIPVAPLYTAADVADLPPVGVPGRPPFVRGATPDGPVPDGWDVRQRHGDGGADPDPGAVHEAVLADLENGVTSIWLATGDGTELPTVLDGVLLDLAAIALDTGGADTGAAAAYLAHAAGGLADPAALLGTLGLDPIGLRARTGVGPDVASVVPLSRRVAAEHPLVRAIVVDAVGVHAAGGADAQELGFSVAAGVAYLRALTDAGLDAATAARLLEFRYATTDEQFPTIAKLRAARRLWARVLSACGAPDAGGQHQHAVSSPTMFTRRDPYVNLLRGTIAGFAAGVGGADAVTVAPFDAALGASTPFSRRVARNTQALLIQEAHLARVVDPAGGAWLVESLTDGLARAAWAFFQEIEAAGGALTALDSGLVAARVEKVREAREKAIATRRTPITGVSEFPDLAEVPVERVAPAPHPNGGLPVYRPAAAFESYRDRSDAVLAATGARPTAFLATLGPLATYSTRASFARNLLAAGGIDTFEAGPTESAEAVAEAWDRVEAPVAVLCSSDALYAERGEAAAAALRSAGARRILVAGRVDVPGVDGQLYAGCDALAVIEGAYVAGSSA